MKIVYTKSVILVLLLTMIAMSSCHEKDEIVLKYTLHLSQDLMDMSDIEVIYTDFEGNVYREDVTECYWEHIIRTPLPPVSSMIKVNCARNANQVVDDYYIFKMDFTCVADQYIDDELVKSVSYNDVFEKHATPADDIATIIKNIELGHSYVIRADSNGNILLDQYND